MMPREGSLWQMRRECEDIRKCTPGKEDDAMALFDIKYQVSQICDYMKGSLTSLHPLAGLVPRPGKWMDPSLTHYLSGKKLSIFVSF